MEAVEQTEKVEAPAQTSETVVSSGPDDGGKPLSKRQMRKRKWNELKKEQKVERKRRKLEELAKSNEEIRGEAEYEIDGALRRVKPYKFVYQVNMKSRWLNRTLIDVLRKEFKAFNDRYLTRAIDSGRIRINDKVVSPDYILSRGDLLLHAIHRHEPPVASSPIPLVHESEDLLVFNKPASIPMHPAGRFRHNTILHLIVREHKLAHIHSVHRLDRLTSGLIIYGKTDSAAHRIAEQIRGGKVIKHYLALVEGVFPPELITVEQPIGVLIQGRGIMGVTPDGKYCKTMFLRLAYDPVRNVSLVKCRPFTGRSHQIRIHLQHLGFPLINDPLYSACGDTMKSHFEEVNVKRFAVPVDETDNKDAGNDNNKDEGKGEGKGPEIDTSLSELASAFPSIYDIPLEVLSADCLDCRTDWPDPKPHELEMCLHALSYQGPGWSFQTPDLPAWAQGFGTTPEQLSMILGDINAKQEGFGEDSD